MKRKSFISLAILSASLLLSSCTWLNPDKPVDDDSIKTVTVYASNDFHGAIEEVSSDDRMGLAYFGSYMKMQSQKENTILLDQGDTWQGSLYSNENRGTLITDVMIEAGFTARTVGNHDFDWGLDAIKNNTARKYNGKSIPTLAANVYDYNFPTKTFGNTQQSDIGDKTTTVTLENGLKVGIVGVIGEDQITSINSQYTRTIGFKDHIYIIKEEATNLRNSGCDIVIASVHSGAVSMLGYDLADYVDLVLCGHSHRRELEEEYRSSDNQKVLFCQYGAYGQYLGEITLKYDATKKKIINPTSKLINYNEVKTAVKEIDPTISRIINNGINEIDNRISVNQVLASNAPYYFDAYVNAPNMMAAAMYSQAVSEGYNDLLLSYCNQARNNLPNGEITFNDIYYAFPFDNQIYIIEVTGEEIKNEIVPYNNIYLSPSYLGRQLDYTKTYKIACIDYLAFHTNKYRYYDYFPSMRNQDTAVQHLSKNYRETLRDWLIENQYDTGRQLNSYNFSNTSTYHNKDNISFYNDGGVTPTTDEFVTPYLTNTTFVTDTTSSVAYAENYDQTITAKVDFSHTPIVDAGNYASTGQFCLGSGDYISATVNSHFVIKSIEVLKHNQWDNFTFTDSDGTELVENNSYNSENNELTHTVTVNDTYVKFVCSYSNVYIKYIKVVLQEVS